MKYEDLNIVECNVRKVNAIKNKKVSFFDIVLVQALICVIALNVFSIFSTLNFTVFNGISDIFAISASAYPGDTFTREEKIKFVSQFLFGDALYVSGNSTLVFSLPLESDTVSIENGIVKITALSFSVVRASEDGIVTKTGLQSDVKFVEIKHTNNISTRYYGLNYLGVKADYITEKNAPLGTIETGKTLEFCVLYKGKVVTDAVIDNGTIIW